MNQQELTEAGQKLFGKFWQTAMAKRLNVNPSTVRRWVAGAAIPGPAAAAIRCWLREKGEDCST